MLTRNEIFISSRDMRLSSYSKGVNQVFQKSKKAIILGFIGKIEIEVAAFAEVKPVMCIINFSFYLS